MSRPAKTIILVDDNEQVLSVRSVVIGTWGYNVVKCACAAEALQWLREAQVGAVDLLLTDLVMPGIDGNELARLAKLIDPFLPALVVSGSVTSFDRANHADWFMPKASCSPAELRERVRLMVARKRGPMLPAKKAAIAEMRIAASAERRHA